MAETGKLLKAIDVRNNTEFSTFANKLEVCAERYEGADRYERDGDKKLYKNKLIKLAEELKKYTEKVANVKNELKLDYKPPFDNSKIPNMVR